MFIEPTADLVPGSGSWFVTSNLKVGNHELGILVHYMEIPFSKPNSTIAITDVTTNLYLLDERKGGSTKIRRRLFDLKITRKSPVLPYNGTGCFPIFDNTNPTWEFAFPVMETTGTVTVKDHTYNITGSSLYGRQWFQGIKANLGSKQGYAH